MNKLFEDLFVLEIANNHLGRMDRAKELINTFSRVVRYNNIKACLKLQFRDVDSFIHKEYKENKDIRYIKKTMETKLSWEEYAELIALIKKRRCLASATPFDEKSVDKCVELGIDIIKIASSDINDWSLIERIAKTGKPVIASSGGSSLKDTDDLVLYFENRNIQFALNHCVALYPSEDSDLELNQIDFLRKRYPNITIGFSSHEYKDWNNSILIAYAKGARTFERHVDLDDIVKSSYCSNPQQTDTWFKAFHKAKQMCGNSGENKRIPSENEILYLDKLVRGVYAKRNLKEGSVIKETDIYLSIPLHKGQLSCRELVAGEILKTDIKKDDMLKASDILNGINFDSIEERGI
jgi:N-acetylneuraminate synthase